MITELTPELLSVDVPEGNRIYKICKFNKGESILYEIKGVRTFIDLPPGQYEIVGMSDETGLFFTAIESFQSLLASKGITERVLIIKKLK